MDSSTNLHQLNFVLADIGAAYHQAALRLHLSDSALAVLYALRDFGDGCPLRSVCQQSGISKQTINSAVRKLEREGIVFLKGNGTGRGKNIYLPDAGASYMQQTAGRLYNMEQDLLASWAAAERRQYLQLLKKYRDCLRDRVRKL